MRTGRTVVRTLNRWQTLWLLCRIGCFDVALVLVIELAKERGQRLAFRLSYLFNLF